MLAEWIIASAGVAAVALRPRSWTAAGVVAALAVVDLGLAGAGPLGTAVRSVWPMLALLAGTLSLSALAVRLGAAERAATSLAALARGSAARLFGLVCLACALLTRA